MNNFDPYTYAVLFNTEREILAKATQKFAGQVANSTTECALRSLIEGVWRDNLARTGYSSWLLGAVQWSAKFSFDRLGARVEVNVEGLNTEGERAVEQYKQIRRALILAEDSQAPTMVVEEQSFDWGQNRTRVEYKGLIYTKDGSRGAVRIQGSGLVLRSDCAYRLVEVPR